MTTFFFNLLFMAIGATIAALFVDHKWKVASKKLFDKINSLQNGLASKQSEINSLNVNLISLNSKIKMLDVSLTEKEKELAEIATKEKLTKLNENTVVNAQQGLRKKRGPYKKKKTYGRPASNNNSGKKAE